MEAYIRRTTSKGEHLKKRNLVSNKRPKLRSSISVVLLLERTDFANTNVIGLLLGQLGEAGTARGQVQGCDLLIENLGEEVHVVLVGLGLLPVLQEIKLSKDLVGERARHHR